MYLNFLISIKHLGPNPQKGYAGGTAVQPAYPCAQCFKWAKRGAGTLLGAGAPPPPILNMKIPLESTLKKSYCRKSY